MNLEATRLRDRPRNRWQDEVREDGRLGGGKGWRERVYNRQEWKKLLRTARNHHILHLPMEWMNNDVLFLSLRLLNNKHYFYTCLHIYIHDMFCIKRDNYCQFCQPLSSTVLFSVTFCPPSMDMIAWSFYHSGGRKWNVQQTFLNIIKCGCGLFFIRNITFAVNSNGTSCHCNWPQRRFMLYRLCEYVR